MFPGVPDGLGVFSREDAGLPTLTNTMISPFPPSQTGGVYSHDRRPRPQIDRRVAPNFKVAGADRTMPGYFLLALVLIHYDPMKPFCIGICGPFGTLQVVL